ncbi:hypothetical protein PVK06_047914 [Gossypium arboreum]|uniref:Reverse transcriptase n=1 Tax=Gossypium arboreum TaxID=29729 RepID=A0ABR0MF06_GOSAR|nr:hypothetical protein PVK06_047914 [Gossypium arboreum]
MENIRRYCYYSHGIDLGANWSKRGLSLRWKINLKMFTTEEIWVAMRNMAPLEAFGLDGFSALFYQCYWNFVGPEVSSFCLSIIRRDITMEEINYTHIVLVLEVTLIMRCLASVSYTVGINGNLSNKILPSKGLRQGDPHSPYLFLEEDKNVVSDALGVRVSSNQKKYLGLPMMVGRSKNRSFSYYVDRLKSRMES